MVGDLIGEGAAQEQAVVGDTPNLAARLQGLAAPGQVVIAEATQRLLGDLFEVEDLGVQNLKGIAARTPVFAVLRERALESRFAARSGGLSPARCMIPSCAFQRCMGSGARITCAVSSRPRWSKRTRSAGRRSP